MMVPVHWLDTLLMMPWRERRWKAAVQCFQELLVGELMKGVAVGNLADPVSGEHQVEASFVAW
jgi:hypothetical protein